MYIVVEQQGQYRDFSPTWILLLLCVHCAGEGNQHIYEKPSLGYTSLIQNYNPTRNFFSSEKELLIRITSSF